MGFSDTLTVSGPPNSFLLLDYAVHGGLANGPTDHVSIGLFAIFSGEDPLVERAFRTVAGVPSEVSGQGSFELAGDRWRYTDAGTVAIPLGAGPIALSASLRAIAGCPAPCSIETDLGETAASGTRGSSTGWARR